MVFLGAEQVFGFRLTFKQKVYRRRSSLNPCFEPTDTTFGSQRTQKNPRKAWLEVQGFREL